MDTTLPIVWFLLIAVLWTGYFVLEGFDFGVGMLLPILAKDERERRVMINTIGPVWDGNEVWLLTAGGATFAAFPEWYATMFSGLYLPLFLILIALILRGVAFEYRHQKHGMGWKRGWDNLITGSSFVASLVLGVAFANFVRGLPIDGARTIHQTAGSLFGLFTPFALLGGVLFVVLFLTHGAAFIALKTDGEIRARARRFASRTGAVAILAMLAFVLWMNLSFSGLARGVAGASPALSLWPAAALAVLGLVVLWLANSRGREGWAFVGGAVSILAMLVNIFAALFPNVMPSTLDPAWSLTAATAASSTYTLKIMTVAAVVITPFVLLYQAWTYWVFRKRLTVRDIPLEAPAPVAEPRHVAG
ncbi:cytochrome bd-I ubiquinol oxidase subunit 2 apoprotein [Raineyella antarctica]|uniref:Cytochrome bd-I ubiquinol oxidase subunit 2 apoprotein n=1 Tax=Raineyella antarctica TaxID=1577474 RepID=A0A1G6GEU0_9ACTN|nr:cytochrome d ubiquinol oxidase subunit II [Raineyella antarctica]SDB80497.1 cytochrome bd-I ubiquinol oxidase subunit 2 apoprotein [Raineyella antarctica]